MIFLVYATESDHTIPGRLGLADYSYYFVMKRFVPALEPLGRVMLVDDPGGVDALHDDLSRGGEDVLLLSFTPPQRTPLGLRCPTLPVFAWEYSTIPNESWGNDPRHNWVWVLKSLPGAITHSQFAVASVRAALGRDFPIASLPAPVWDEYAPLSSERWLNARELTWRVDLDRGVILDSHALGLDKRAPDAPPSFAESACNITLDGVVYTAVFNPSDGRKNWHDLVSAFCFAFRDNPQVTLLLKLAYHDARFACDVVWTEMIKLAPYRCRVVALHGFLDSGTYRHIVAHSTYVVNSAYGEGQCLPLMEFMSAGKPAIAPNHTAMADYINSENAFVVRSSEEWTHWPHDPRLVLRAFRYRLDWQSLRDAYLESFRVACDQPERYGRMARAAHLALEGHCSRLVIGTRLGEFLRDLGHRPARYPQLKLFLRNWQRFLRRLLSKD